MKLFRSFAFKNAIFYFFIFLVGLGTIGFLMLNNSSNRIIKTAKDQLTHNGDLVQIQLSDYINGLLSQLDYLSNSPVLSDYLKDEDQDSYRLLSQNYLSLIQSNKDFSQIRFIESSNGKEVVRVDQSNSRAKIISLDQLQYKKDRTYFQETVKLDYNGIYFSKINLNRESDTISKPLTPTLRIASPIYHKNKLRGVIVINTDLTKLFDRLKQTVGDDFILRMVNEEGYYLMHENVDSTFTFEFGSNKPQINPTENSLMKSGIVNMPQELMSVHRIGLKAMNYDFIFQLIANRSTLMGPYYDWRKKSLLLIVITGLIFTIIAFYILNKQSQTFSRLTKSMKEFPKEKHIGELPIHRDDEIGDLAKSFEEMAEIIKSQISSIEKEKLNAELAEQEKSEFIENISHEIRNPLQSIVGLSKILEQNNPNPNQIDILNSIKLNTSNLIGLVNNILDYQNVINGNYKSEFTWLSIDLFVQELLTGNQYAASQKAIKLESKTDGGLENIEIELDQLRISQILNNLISNAITHTPVNGKIFINSELIEKKGNKVKIAFSVADDGAGMSKKDLLLITKRYFTNQETKLKNSNFGLGLTIVNELLNHLGSELKVSSQKDVGSTFYFEIETEFRAKELKKTDLHHKEEIDTDIKALFIDDDEQILNHYKHLFNGINSKFLSSFDDLAADKIRHYDLIVSDYRLRTSLLVNHVDQLKAVSSDSTCLIIASGTEPNLDPIQKVFPEVQLIKKPFDNIELKQLINKGLILSKYGIPQLDAIKADYDYDDSKYKHALDLLVSEWETYKHRFDKCITEANVEEFDEILHKFNTTLRRLMLQKLESRLYKVKAQMQSNPIQEQEEVNLIMGIYLTYLEQSI